MKRCTISAAACASPHAATASATTNVDYVVFCFAEAPDANLFRERFSSERFNSKDRGRGAAWHR